MRRQRDVDVSFRPPCQNLWDPNTRLFFYAAVLHACMSVLLAFCVPQHTILRRGPSWTYLPIELLTISMTLHTSPHRANDFRWGSFCSACGGQDHLDFTLLILIVLVLLCCCILCCCKCCGCLCFGKKNKVDG